MPSRLGSTIVGGKARHGYDAIEKGGMKRDTRNHSHDSPTIYSEIIQMRHAAVFLHATIHDSCTVYNVYIK